MELIAVCMGKNLALSIIRTILSFGDLYSLSMETNGVDVKGTAPNRLSLCSNRMRSFFCTDNRLLFDYLCKKNFPGHQNKISLPRICPERTDYFRPPVHRLTNVHGNEYLSFIQWQASPANNAWWNSQQIQKTRNPVEEVTLSCGKPEIPALNLKFTLKRKASG